MMILNVLLVLAGGFLADFSALLLTSLTPWKRWTLGAVGLVGFGLLLARVPFDASKLGVLASAAYAAIACALAIGMATRMSGVAHKRAMRWIGVTMGVSMAAMVALLVWVDSLAIAA